MGRPRSSGTVERWTHRTLFLAFALMWLLAIARQIPGLPWFGKAHWIEPTLLVAALLISVSIVAQEIPFPNVLMAAGIIALVGGTAHWLSYDFRIPFGPLQFPYARGRMPLQEWFWVPAVLWVILLLNARGLARLILDRRVKRPNHGLQVIGLSAGLVVFLALALEPFASTVHRYWLWGPTRLPITWEGVPLSALFAWGAVSVVALIAATAVLIDKHPRPLPPSTEPLWIWAMMAGLFGLGTAIAGLWMPAVAAFANVLLALAMARIVRQQRCKTEKV